MQSPYIVVGLATSKVGLISSNNIGAWGEVMQINPSTYNVAVGDFVFYNQVSPSVYCVANSSFYNTIDEGDVIFIEAP